MTPPAQNVEKWTAERIPDQSVRLAIVTGANSGLGAHRPAGETRARRTSAAARRTRRSWLATWPQWRRSW